MRGESARRDNFNVHFLDTLHRNDRPPYGFGLVLLGFCFLSSAFSKALWAPLGLGFSAVTGRDTGAAGAASAAPSPSAGASCFLCGGRNGGGCFVSSMYAPKGLASSAFGEDLGLGPQAWARQW